MLGCTVLLLHICNLRLPSVQLPGRGGSCLCSQPQQHCYSPAAAAVTPPNIYPSPQERSAREAAEYEESMAAAARLQELEGTNAKLTARLEAASQQQMQLR